MILTGPAIRTAVKRGEISLTPFNETNLNPNSYNFHLGESLLTLGNNEEPSETILLGSRGYILQPGRLYLGNTFEQIGSNKYVILLLGRSSMGRIGLFLNVTADMGHLGCNSRWTLEMKVVQPLRIYPRMKVGQVSFWLTDALSTQRYIGRYHGDIAPAENKDLSILNPTR